MDGMDVPLMDSWAESVCAAAEVGDARCTARLIALAHHVENQPTDSFPDATADKDILCLQAPRPWQRG